MAPGNLVCRIQPRPQTLSSLPPFVVDRPREAEEREPKNEVVSYTVTELRSLK